MLLKLFRLLEKYVMPRAVLNPLFAIALVGLAALSVRAADDATLRFYGEVPGGVVLEGVARGFEDLKDVAYDKDKDEFVLNGKDRYKNPISRKEWVALFRALKKDDLLGVSLSNGEPRVYGAMGKSSSLVANLVETDKILGGIIYGLHELLGDMKLPANYKPKRTDKRKIQVIAFTAFTNYEFEKKDGRYFLRDNSLNVQIIPLAKDKNESGGHMPDEEVFKGFIMEDSDRENIAHLKSFQGEYFKMEPMSATNKWGEAAAFTRLVRETNIDHEELLKVMK